MASTPRVVSNPSGAFARLSALAMSARSSKAEEKKDDEKDAAAAEDEKKDEDAAAAEDEKKDEDAATSDDENASEDDDDGEEDASEDDDGGEDAKKSARAARRAERTRISSIINSKEASRSQAHFSQALYLSLMTGMSSASAIGMLRCMPVSEGTGDGQQAAARKAARERMDSTPNPTIKDDAEDGAQPSTAAMIIAAGKKRRGEK